MKEIADRLISYLSSPVIVLKGKEITFANYAAEFIGYSCVELLGKSIESFIPEYERGRFLKMLNELESHKRIEGEFVLKGERREFLVKLVATKIDDHALLELRDISKERSYEKVIRMAIDVEMLLPNFDREVLNATLRRHFDAEIAWMKNAIGEGFEIPIGRKDEVFGYLRIRFPKWFVMSDEILKLLKTLADEIKESVIIKNYAEAVNKALIALNRAVYDFAVLVDGIRNPLAVIYLYAELINMEFGAKIKEHVDRIVKLIEEIEDGWKLVENIEKEIREKLQSGPIFG